MGWPIVVGFVIGAGVLAAVLRGAIHGRGDRPAEFPGYPADDTIAPRDELARNAGVASFGLNLPWRRPRGVPAEYRGRRRER